MDFSVTEMTAVVQLLDPIEVIDICLDANLITLLEHEGISQGYSTRAEKCRELYWKILKRGDQAKLTFIEALKKTCQNELANILEESYNAEKELAEAMKTAKSKRSPSPNVFTKQDSVDQETSNVRLLELRERLSISNQVIHSIRSDLQEIQIELKRDSQNYTGNPKYQRSVELLNSLDKEEREFDQTKQEFTQVLLKDMNEQEEEGENSRSSNRSSQANSLVNRVTDESGVTLKGIKHLKCVLAGDGGTGKTSIIHRFMHQKQMTAYVPTVHDTRQIEILHNNYLIEIEFWDTAGQDEYDAIRPLAYKDADVLVLVYSITSQMSLENILVKWHPEIRHYCPRAPLILVGNKTDPPTEAEMKSLTRNGMKFVDPRQAHTLAEKISAASKKSVLCSAVSGDGIKELQDLIMQSGLGYYSKKNRKREKIRSCACM